MSLEVVVLNCRNCGASLSIPSALDQLACSFCGTAQVVKREGGVTFLERDVETMRQGIARVEGRMGEIADATEDTRHRISRLESIGQRLRLEREREGIHHKLEQGRLGCFGWFAIVTGISAVVSAFERGNARPGGLAFGGAVALVLLIRESGRAGLRKQVRELDARIAAIGDG